MSRPFDDLIDIGISAARRLESLEATLRGRDEEISGILAVRHNSFTAARRFLTVQVLLGAYSQGYTGQPIRFADLGTGLGILPRQLNSRELFSRYSVDLRWGGGKPAFLTIPLAARFGVERSPRPDLNWVRACYGASDYYENIYHELQASLSVPEVATANVSYAELDIIDQDALAAFVRDQRVNAVNLSYVLYEIDPGRRVQIIDTLQRVLRPPRFMLVTEPTSELARPGCTVTLYDDSQPEGQQICSVSDGHFRGDVTPMDDYASFVSRHPIPVEF